MSPPGILMYQENPQWNGPLSSIKFAVIVEAALESAPLFVIQLYAMAVQQESVTIVPDGFSTRVFPDFGLGVYCC